jgi:hypothetical protein
MRNCSDYIGEEGGDDVEVWKNYLSAGGAAGNEDQVPLSSAQPGAEVFGLAGPIIYSVGITNGKNSTDVNLDKNYFTTIGLRKNDGPWAGSQLSVYGLKGTDTKNASTALVRDNFYRLSPGVNLRHGSADFILAPLQQDEQPPSCAEQLRATIMQKALR